MKSTILIVLFSLLFFSCSENLDVNPNDYPKSKGAMLTFDLSSPNYPTSLIVNQLPVLKKYSYFLPFKIIDQKNSIELLSAIGGYEKFTYIHLTNFDNTGMHTIFIKPSISEFETSDVSTNTPEDGVYIIRNGLERLFIYDYDFINTNKEYFQINNITSDSLNYIAIKLPTKSVGKEIENGNTSIPDPLFSQNNVKLFPGMSHGKLKVKYELQNELRDSNWFYLILKSFILLLVPSIEIIISFGIQKKKTKLIVLVTFILLEIGSLITMLVLVSKDKFLSPNVIIDLITTVFIGISGTLIMYLKDKRDRKIT